MHLYKTMLILSITITMCINLWKTVCSEINIPFLLKFCLGYYFLENFKTDVAYKRLTYKTCANSNLNADQSNFLAN